MPVGVAHIERDHPRNEPLLPHLVHFALKEFDVFFVEVGEPSLLEQIVADRKAFEPLFGNLLRLAVEFQLAALHLVEWPDARVHRQVAELKGKQRVEVPTLKAGV